MEQQEMRIKEIRAKRRTQSDNEPTWVLKRVNGGLSYGWECHQYGERFTVDFVKETKRGFTFETYICDVVNTIFIDRSKAVIVYELENETDD